MSSLLILEDGNSIFSHVPEGVGVMGFQTTKRLRSYLLEADSPFDAYFLSTVREDPRLPPFMDGHHDTREFNLMDNCARIRDRQDDALVFVVGGSEVVDAYCAFNGHYRILTGEVQPIMRTLAGLKFHMSKDIADMSMRILKEKRGHDDISGLIRPSVVPKSR